MERGRRLLFGGAPTPRTAGLLDREGEDEGAFGGAFAARSCSIAVECARQSLLLTELPRLYDREGEEAASRGAPAARGCSIERWRRLLLGELLLCGAAQLREGKGCLWGSFRCVGLLDGALEGGCFSS